MLRFVVDDSELVIDGVDVQDEGWTFSHRGEYIISLETALGSVGAYPYSESKAETDGLCEWLNVMRLLIIEDFVQQVNSQAEINISKTGKLEGSHYAAMTKLLNTMQKEAERF